MIECDYTTLEMGQTLFRVFLIFVVVVDIVFMVVVVVVDNVVDVVVDNVVVAVIDSVDVLLLNWYCERLLLNLLDMGHNDYLLICNLICLRYRSNNCGGVSFTFPFLSIWDKRFLCHARRTRRILNFTHFDHVLNPLASQNQIRKVRVCTPYHPIEIQAL